MSEKPVPVEHIEYPQPYLVDTCCVVKMLVDEGGPATARMRRLRDDKQSVLYVTEYTVPETLCVLKKNRDQKRLTQAEYRKAVFDLFVLRDGRLQPQPLPGSWIGMLRDAEMEMPQADLIDAVHFQVMKRTILSHWGGPSTAILVSTDAKLVAFARAKEKLAWNPGVEECPPRPA